MRTFLNKIIAIVVVFLFCCDSFSQKVNYLKTQRERKEYIKSLPQHHTLIVYDLDTLSVKEFITLDADSIDDIYILPSDTACYLYGDSGTNGAIQIWSKNMLSHLLQNESPVETSNNRFLFRQIEKTALLQFASKLHSYQIKIDGKNVNLQDFLRFPDDNIEELVLGLNPLRTKGNIVISSRDFIRETNLGFRGFMVKQFRINELETFFGFQTPVFNLDGKAISKNDFLNLNEDTIAFINYYMTDFVKYYYGKNGLVYILTNKNKRNISYRELPELPIPIEGRAHILNYDWYPTTSWNINSFTQEWLKNHPINKISNGSNKVMVSCVIETDGHINPIVVTDIEHYETYKDEEIKSLVETAMAIIRAMPKWEPVYKDGDLTISDATVTLAL